MRSNAGKLNAGPDRRVLLVAVVPVVAILCLAGAGQLKNFWKTGTLVDAAATGDLRQIKLHIRSHEPVNVRDAAGRTPLSAALDHPEAMKYLLDHGAMADLPAESQNTPLFTACAASNLAAVQVLLDHGANIDQINEDSETPLLQAVATSRPQVAIFLLQHGASTDIPNNIGAVAAHYAAGVGDVDVLAALYERKANLNAQSMIGITPLGRAVLNGRKGAVEFLLKHGAKSFDKDFTLLHYAALIGGYSTQFKIIVEPRMGKFSKEMHTSTRQAYSGTDPFVQTRSPEIIELLVRSGLSVNASGKGGLTPLQLAAMSHNGMAKKSLLKAGANPHRTESRGKMAHSTL